ncbi:tail fiber domain-containing protein [Flavobacterium sp. SH_e]|uniref:tail fiber domain-containing protein n=1 Tax=Flavobacterium sp. SH_e TaxID=2983767 RepID=UPI0021E43619|nr:tail fiber domain-containing protein [Flavobacterium sp. SH_e]MCV2486422.1 tail fiber domain-containing protein [Flavobacterium sp. SH_e]
MRKIILMLTLIQSGFVMAQTETEKVVTPNGKKVKVYTNPVTTVDNGLNRTDGNVQLGGDLTKPTLIKTTSENPLAIGGLQNGTLTDQLLTTDANGVLRKISNGNWWNTNGNTGTIAGTNFIGTTDDQDLVFKRQGYVIGRLTSSNISFGSSSLTYNTTGDQNSAFGRTALLNNTTGSNNTALGAGALARNTVGEKNTAVGVSALPLSNSANRNVAVGEAVFGSLLTGNNNIALGFGSGRYFGDNAATNLLDNSTESMFIGAESRALLNGSKNEIVIGYNARGKGSNTVTIGNSQITEIGGYAPWSNYSDSRLKKNIVSSTYGLDFINKLRPVLYNMKTGTTELQSGFIAQEVESAANSIGYKFSGIVKPQSDTDFYSLRYSDFVVPLVKSVQELKKQLEEKEERILDLENRLLKLEQKLK